MTTEADTRGIWPQAKGCWEAAKLEEAKEGFSPRASKGKQGPADI